jgi:hypothetical protein
MFDLSLRISGKIAVQCFNLAMCRSDQLHYNCSHTSQRTVGKGRTLVETFAFRHIGVCPRRVRQISETA